MAPLDCLVDGSIWFRGGFYFDGWIGFVVSFYLLPYGLLEWRRHLRLAGITCWAALCAFAQFRCLTSSPLCAVKTGFVSACISRFEYVQLHADRTSSFLNKVFGRKRQEQFVRLHNIFSTRRNPALCSDLRSPKNLCLTVWPGGIGSCALLSGAFWMGLLATQRPVPGGL